MINASLFQDEEYSNLETTQLIEILRKSLLLQRGRALYELARRTRENTELMDLVTSEIRDPKNRSARTIGIVSIAFLGLAGLLEADTEMSRKAASEIIETWEEPDRSNLLEFIRPILPPSQPH